MKVLVGNLEELGYKKVIVRSDQEPAIVKLKSAVKRDMAQEVICEESPVGEAQSLGSVSIQVQIVQGQVRTLRDALETRYGKRID